VVIIVLAVLNMLSGSMADLPKIIETVAYVVGIYLAVTGIFKLGNACSYLAAGVGLLALPYLTQSSAGSINNGSSNVGYMEGLFAPPTFSGGSNLAPPNPSLSHTQAVNEVSHVSNILSNPIASNAAVLCMGLFLGLAAWTVYSRIKKR
jgi:hypothetical protein